MSEITLAFSEQEKTFINKFAEKAEKIKPIPEWHPLEILLAIAGDAQEMEDDNSRLKEENKRLREALEEMVQRYDAAEESSEIWDGPDYLGSYNMFQAECSEIIGIARSALKEE